MFRCFMIRYNYLMSRLQSHHIILDLSVCFTFFFLFWWITKDVRFLRIVSCWITCEFVQFNVTLISIGCWNRNSFLHFTLVSLSRWCWDSYLQIFKIGFLESIDTWLWLMQLWSIWLRLLDVSLVILQQMRFCFFLFRFWLGSVV